jgi:uncharacterized protein YijF (DUF1287 family)
VPADRGVCTDVVIRAYRQLGIDLQRDVHEGHAAHFAPYPIKKWGDFATRSQYRHRRVPNCSLFRAARVCRYRVTDLAPITGRAIW